MGTLVHIGTGVQGALFSPQPAPLSRGRAASGLFWVLLPDRLTCQPSDRAGTGQAHLAKLSPFRHLGLFQGGVCLEAGLARHTAGLATGRAPVPTSKSWPCPRLALIN